MRIISIMISIVVIAFLLVSPIWAQLDDSAKVIYSEGNVLVKALGFDRWIKVNIGMNIEKGSTIKTEANSYCEIALDSKLKNTVKIEENSEVTLDRKTLGAIELPKGRVFSLIKNLDKGSKFEIKTPVAIAGVRGTGLGVGSEGDRSSVQCYESGVYVGGEDQQGNPTEQINVPEGFQVDIDQDGQISDLFEIEDDQWGSWGAWKEQQDEHKDDILSKETPEDDREDIVEDMESEIEMDAQALEDLEERSDMDRIEQILDSSGSGNDDRDSEPDPDPDPCQGLGC